LREKINCGIPTSNWENFRYKFNLEMSQKGVCDTFLKERSNNAEECKLFDKLWGALGNNVGIMFRSILTEAKEKASANENYALIAFNQIKEQCIGNLHLQQDQVRTEWLVFKQHSGENVDEYLQRFNKLRSSLESLQEKITEEQAIHRFMVGSMNPNIKMLKTWLDKQNFKSVFEVAMKLRADEYEQLSSAKARSVGRSMDVQGFGGFNSNDGSHSASRSNHCGIGNSHYHHSKGYDSMSGQQGRGKQHASGRI
jgi:hypothetical protein